MGCVLQSGLRFIMYIALQIRWCVVMWFFHSFWSLHGKYPPNPCIFLLRCDKGSALHISCMVFEIKCIIWSNVVHAMCHCSGLRYSFSFSMFFNSLMIAEFCKKNFRLNISLLFVV